MQRASDLKLPPHLHALFFDGVYVPGVNSAAEFRALPRLSTSDVADALQVATVLTSALKNTQAR